MRSERGNPRQFDAIIIGSGLGGCAAAAYLAAAGQRVLLLERYSVLGGSSHVFRRQGKWEFDCGVHYIGDCGPEGPVPTLLRGLGLDDRINWLPLDPAGHDTTLAPGLELRTPHGWDAYLANLVEAFPEDARGLRRFVSTIRRLGESWDRSLTPSSTREFTGAMRRSGPAASFALAPYISLLLACGLKPRTILALSVQCGAMASTPLTVPTLVMANYYTDFVGGGAWFPQGGGQMLAAGFAEVVTSHGGQIRTGVGVERILLESGRVVGVRLDSGERMDTAVVISGADILRTYSDLVGLEHLPAAYRHRVRRWTMSPPLINGFFGVDVDLSASPNTNYFAIPDWGDARSLLSLRGMLAEVTCGKGHSDGRAWAREFARRQPMFLQSSSQRDPGNRRAAPLGHSVIEVQTLAPSDPRLWGFAGYDVEAGGYRRDQTYLEVKKIITDGMLERMEQAYPGSTSRIKISELGTPASQERFVGNTGGSAYGLASRPSQSGPFRPGVRTPIPGLFLAGTSTAWGPATEGSMLSGVHAAGAALGRDLASEVRDGAVIADQTRLNRWGADFDALDACRGFGRADPPTVAVSSG